LKLSTNLSKAAHSTLHALLIAGGIAIAAPASAAPIELITNGSFETGTLAGWTTGSSGASNAFYLVGNGGNGPISGHPTQVNPTGGAFIALSDQNSSGGEVLQQSFTKTAGMSSLMLNFDWFDNTHSPFSGTAIDGSGQAGRVDIMFAGAAAFDTGAGVATNLLINAGATTGFGTTIPWQHSTFDLSSLAAGTYKLRFGNGQCCYFQEFGVDNVSLVAAVPEPGSLALGVIGLVGLGWNRRRKPAASAA
jgi:hypothetical protein